MNFLNFFTDKVVPIFSNLSAPQIIFLCLLTLSILAFLLMQSKNNAYKLTIVFVVYVILASTIAVLLDFSKELYMIFILSFVIGSISVFALEIKREIWNTGKNKLISSDVANTVKANQHKVNANINEIIKAVQNMSKNDVGAIIVLSNTKIPNTIIDSGVKINSDISSALIESIFFPKTPLHDGAIILQNDKVLAAGCFLPLSQESTLPKELGTRHRAGIGITEVLNVTAIIVSEETGIISYARGGKITRYIDSAGLRNLLKEFYWQDLLANTKGGKNE